MRRKSCIWKFQSQIPTTAFSFATRNGIEKSDELSAFLKTYRHSDTSAQQKLQNILLRTTIPSLPRRKGTREKGRDWLQGACKSEGASFSSLHCPCASCTPAQTNSRLRAGGAFGPPKACLPCLCWAGLCPRKGKRAEPAPAGQGTSSSHPGRALDGVLAGSGGG